jgi:hypothetical protein
MTATATPVPTVTAAADSAAGDAVAEFFKANNIPDANAAPADGTAETPDQNETDPTATGQQKPEVTDDTSKTDGRLEGRRTRASGRFCRRHAHRRGLGRRVHRPRQHG